MRGEEHLTFNAGTIQGGTDVDYEPGKNRGTTFGKTNVVPRKLVVHGGIRTMSQDQLDQGASRHAGDRRRTACPIPTRP